MDQKQPLEEGWCLIDNEGWYEIQKDDAADIFEGDFDAYCFVAEKADAGFDYHQRAIQRHERPVSRFE